MGVITKLIFLQLLQVTYCLNLIKVEEIVEMPLITIQSEGDWKMPTNGTVLSEIDIAANPQGSQIQLACSAPYPIQWRVKGYQGREFFRAGTTKTVLVNNGKWTYNIEIWNGFPAPASAKILCKHFKNSSIFSSLSVFVTDKTSVFLQNVRERYPVGRKVPCASTDPRARIVLFKRVTNTRSGIVRVEAAHYDHTEGFTLDRDDEGEFICRARNETKVVILESPEKNNPHIVTNAVWLSDENVYLRCNESTGEIISKSGKISESSDGNQYINSYQLNPLSTEILLDGRYAKNSTYFCQNVLGTRSTTLIYLFLEAPKLNFNTRAGEIDCISESRNKSIAGVRCENRNDCFLLRNCFKDDNCKNDRQTYFQGEMQDTTCNNADSCISMLTTFFNGLIECGVSNGLRNTIFEFFTGLLLIKYSNWRNAPKEELIRMDEVPPVLYANSTSYFYCEVVAYLFSDSFHYSITYSNGSTIFLNSDSYSVDESKQTDRRKIQDFNLISGIRISLPIDATELTCHNSLATEPIIFNASRKFVVKYLQPSELDKTNKNIKLIRGSEGRLTCKATGEPLPEITFVLMNKDSNVTFSQVKTTLNGEAILEFSKVDDSVAGVYLCTARNIISADAFTFEVTLVEPRETTLYAVILVTLVVICLLVVVSFYFWRQQKFARDLLRELTENEIDEFLYGNKDMWTLHFNSPNKQENIDYMPYNNDYEIPIQSLELDLDETSLLGSGEYGMIVKGIYEENFVAVKTTKPLADILYFKALLSELKVMIYIGEQENIVRLIGACTESIRDRKIYIVFELCSLGNLEKYLRENRNSFVEDETLEDRPKSNHSDNIQVLTISNFIRWSWEIACAMEWLSNKKVIHADLATRNILLNENRVAKLSDFGLSLKLYQDTNYVKRKQTPLPFRWMAIESLKQLKFSTETDVWSYGVTVWEIFAMGDIPFPGETWNNLFVSLLTNGHRLLKPKCCPQLLYDDILMACWKSNPEERPSFTVLKHYFQEILSQEQTDVIVATGSNSTENVEMHANEPIYIDCD